MNRHAERFASMQEAELYRVANEIKDLNAEAREALRAEFVRRHLSTKKVNWKVQSGQPDKRKPTSVGDADGEHLEIRRGSYSAWVHVALSFLLEVIIFAVLCVFLTKATLRGEASVSVGAGFGAIIAALIYWNRWRCIEAYSSSYCSGIVNFSLLYVPVVALLYANHRGFLKLKGR